MSEPLPPEQARSVIEAVLLSAESPVTVARLTEVIDGHGAREVARLVEELREEYSRNGRGFTIVEVAGGYQLATRAELSPWLRRFHKDRHQVRLSQAALETLAIIAFKQPLTRIEVDSIRGVNSAGVLQTLMEVGMVRITGRSDGIGKPMLFGTTREFLVHFGLKTLADLPKPRELEELLAEGEQKARERAATSGDGQPASEEGTAETGAEPGDGRPPDEDQVDTSGTGAPEVGEEGSGPESVVAWEDDDEEGEAVEEDESADPEDEPLESGEPWPDEPEDPAADDLDADAEPLGPEPAEAWDSEGNEETADESGSADAEQPAPER